MIDPIHNPVHSDRNRTVLTDAQQEPMPSNSTSELSFVVNPEEVKQSSLQSEQRETQEGFATLSDLQGRKFSELELNSFANTDCFYQIKP